MFNRDTFCERIKVRRCECKLSQNKVEEKLNLAQGTVSKWEKGRVSPSLDDVAFLCELYKCDAGYLFGEYDTPTRDNADIYAATGLSVQAINNIRNYNDRDVIEILNAVLESEYFYEALDNIYKAIEVRESSLVRFERELAEDMKNTLGIDALTMNQDDKDDKTFDDAISMLSQISPNLTVLNREDASLFHLANARDRFYALIQSIV